MKLAPSPRIEVLENRITPAPVFNAVNLFSGLDGEKGFTVTGGGINNTIDVTIESVANAGDVNGDGIKDLLIGVPFDAVTNVRGRVLVVFGKADGFTSNLDLNNLGADGVVIRGEAAGDQFGASVAGVGDVNGDGIDDFVVGAPGVDNVNPDQGAAYVIFGQSAWSTAAINASTLVDGLKGFKLLGERRTGIGGIGQAVGGYTLVGAGKGGDFNNDGFADVLVGAQDIQAFTQINAQNTGALFVVYGKATAGPSGSAFPTSFKISDINGTNGVMIASRTGGMFMGSEVGFVGDVNQDGFTDVAMGNAEAGGTNRTSYVIFGRATTAGAVITLEDIVATDGFKGIAPFQVNFKGNQAYGSEWVMRDIDGDGDQDLGVSYSTSGFVSSGIPISNGYAFVKNNGRGYTTNPFGNLNTELRTGLIGYSNVGAEDGRFELGDFNGDGFYDIAAVPRGTDVPEPPLLGVFNGKAPAKSYLANNAADSSGTEFTGLNLPSNNGSLDPRPYFVGDISGDGVDDVFVIAARSTNAAASVNGYAVFGDAFALSKDGRSVTLTDVDGDKVTVKTSKGVFTREMFTFNAPAGAVQNGREVALLDLTVGDAAADAAFAGTSLTVSVKKAGGGDGRANVGAINATGIDLGSVVIAGGLGTIDAGDADLTVGGLSKLDVYRLGRTLTGPAVAPSDIVGRIGSIIVDTDFAGTVLNVTGGATEGISSMTVTGAFTSSVVTAGPIGTLKMGELLSGTIDGNGTSTKKTNITTKAIADGVTLDFATTIGKLTATQVGAATITAPRIDTITTKGDTRATVPLPGSFGATVNATGGLGTLSVKENFSGVLSLTTATGTLGSVKAFDILAGATITAQGTTTKKTSITAHVIEDGVSIEIASTISKLTAARIGSVGITADRIDSLSVNGDSRAGIIGDLAADIFLDNAGATGDVRTLGTVKVAGTFKNATIKTGGSVGSFTAAAMQNAELLVGFTSTTNGQPLGGGTFIPEALLGKFTITGKVALAGAAPATASMDDSFVVATELGTVSLATIDTTTGVLQWGFAYRDAIKSLKVKEPVFTYDTVLAGTQTAGQFSVRKL